MCNKIEFRNNLIVLIISIRHSSYASPMKIISSIYIAAIAPFICGAAVITTAQLYSSKPEHKFCAGLNPARGVSEMVRISGNNSGWK